MTKDQLDQIIEQAQPLIAEQLGNLHEHIMEAAGEALSATQDSEGGGKPKVSVGIKLIIGLASAPPTYQVKASVGVTYSTETEPRMIENPDQMKLELEVAK